MRTSRGMPLSYYHVILWALQACQILCFSGNTKKWGAHCLICALRLVLLSTVLEGRTLPSRTRRSCLVRPPAAAFHFRPNRANAHGTEVRVSERPG